MSTTEPDAVMASAVARLLQGDVITVHVGRESLARYYLGSETWFMGFLINMRLFQPIFRPRMLLPMPMERFKREANLTDGSDECQSCN